jgi:hypothetical protein
MDVKAYFAKKGYGRFEWMFQEALIIRSMEIYVAFPYHRPRGI